MKPDELEQTLRGAGIVFTDLDHILDSSGEVFEATLIVPASQAFHTWDILRQRAPAFPHWPLLGGESGPQFAEGERLLDWHREMKGAPDCTHVDPEPIRESARRLIEEAARLTPDPRTFHRWHRGSFENLSEESWRELCQRGPKEAVECSPEGEGEWDEAGEEGHRVICLEPTPIPWEVFAYNPWGGWNGVPYPAEQLVMLRHWHENHGAVPLRVNGDSYELYVSRPPTTWAAALLLAREITGFGEETVLGYGTQDPDYAFQVLRRAKVWRFWWD